MSETLPSSPTPQREILSVSDLNRKARQLLETHLSLLWVEGELSNVATPSSGHWYFTLKDENAQVRCAMFKNRNQSVRFKPAQGQQVMVRARVSLYEGRGDYQLIVEHMEEAGLGVLQRAFDALKAKLSKEGLFDDTHKQAIPEFPKHLAVITSPTGAAIRDVLSVLARRFPALPVTVLPVPVQGEGAAEKIVHALELANSVGDFDLILLTRGGGSLEDLWPFNEEVVARAIYASKLPVISAVGHEVDFTISDFVADVRAPTPSAAAELLSPDGDELLNTFAAYELLLGKTLLLIIKQGQQQLKHLRARLRHPGERLQSKAQHLDGLELRMRKAIEFSLHETRGHLKELALRQSHLRPDATIQRLRERNFQLAQRSKRAIQQRMASDRQRLSQWVEVLESVSPLQTLARGYSVLRDRQGVVITSSSAVKVGSELTAKLREGELVCTVTATTSD